MKYSCKVIAQNCSKLEANDRSLPQDAKLITYQVDGEIRYDIARAPRMVDAFDFYYDTYGPGSILSIVWTEGRANPKLFTMNNNERK